MKETQREGEIRRGQVSERAPQVTAEPAISVTPLIYKVAVWTRIFSGPQNALSGPIQLSAVYARLIGKLIPKSVY